MSSVNLENMKTWIEVLESGKYEQSTAVLRSKEGFCCFGVLCDMRDVEWVEKNGKFFYIEDEENHTHVPGLNVLNWLGIDWMETVVSVNLLTAEQHQRAEIARNDKAVGVASLNDHGFSFAEIAALLRSQYGIS